MVVKKCFEKNFCQRTISFLPNILTSLNLFCGFYAIIVSLEGNFDVAAFAIVMSGGFDSLDGRVARATNSTSKFGAEYDSMADLVSFGLAPSILIYLWMLKPLGYLGLLTSFFFIVCSALRLARFNVYSEMLDDCSGSFVGLPVTASAGMIAATVLFFLKIDFKFYSNAYIILPIPYLLSFLMISTIKYVGFKKYSLFKKINLNKLILFMLIFIFIASQPSIALFIFGVVYILSGPVLTILNNKTVNIEESKVPEGLDQN